MALRQANPLHAWRIFDVDEDIPIVTPSPIDDEELPVAVNTKSNGEIRIGPITRARAKLLEQQVNSLLV